MLLHFTKMNGAGNDFVVVDNRQNELALSREQIARLCDRHRGVGADGLLAVESSMPTAPRSSSAATAPAASPGSPDASRAAQTS